LDMPNRPLIKGGREGPKGEETRQDGDGGGWHGDEGPRKKKPKSTKSSTARALAKSLANESVGGWRIGKRPFFTGVGGRRVCYASFGAAYKPSTGT